MTRTLARNVLLVLALTLTAAALSCGDDDTPAGTGPTGSMSGTIQFRGSWPANGSIYVTVNAGYPPTGAPDAFTTAITPSMLTPQRTFDWKLTGIEVGTYDAILIGWRGGPGDDRCIGMYWEYVDSLGVSADCSSVPPGPKPVQVKKGVDTPGIDMIADLGLAN